MNLPESREEGLGVPTFPHGSIGSEINVQPILVSTQLWTTLPEDFAVQLIEI